MASDAQRHRTSTQDLHDARRNIKEGRLEIQSAARKTIHELQPGEIQKAAENLISTISNVRAMRGHYPWMEMPAISGAAERGYVFSLLEALPDLPLAQFPVLARESIRYYKRYISMKAKTLEPLDQRRGLHVLLSNYIIVPGPAAEEMLDEVAEEILLSDSIPQAQVLDSESEPSTPGADVFQPAQYKANPEFPQELRPLFFKRWFRDIHTSADATYDESTQRLYIDGNSYDLSPLDELVKQENRMSPRKMPELAAYSAFVYNGPAIPTGAFVYLDKQKKVIGLNVLSTDHLPVAYVFGEFEEMNKTVANYLCSLSPETSRPHSVTIESLRAKGVSRYVYVGPDAQQKLFPKESDEYMYRGGFAYFFANEEYNRFFPLKATIELKDAALLDWELNAAVLEKVPTESQFTRSLLKPSFRNSHSSPSTVKLYRVNVPHVVHPLVINALARTPRQEAMRSRVAQAIVMTAWPDVEIYYYFDFFCTLLDATVLLWLTHVLVSSLSLDNEGYTIATIPTGNGRALLWEDGPHVSILWFVFTIVKKVLEDLVCVLEWREVGGQRSVYWDLRKRCILAFRYLGIMLILMTVACEITHGDLIQLLPRRVVIAVAGLLKWFDVLFHLRGLKMLGPRILPILNVFADVIGFFVVMTCMMIAFAQANYALSRAGLVDIFVNTWSLGLMGEFALADYVYNVEDAIGKGTGLTAPQHPGFTLLIFLTASFTLTVVLTNIFIGVICTSYKKHAKLAVALFLQRRASMCVDYMLILNRIRSTGVTTQIRSLCGCHQNDEVRPCTGEKMFVWFCHGAEEDDNDPLRNLETHMNNIVVLSRKELLKELKSVDSISQPKVPERVNAPTSDQGTEPKSVDSISQPNVQERVDAPVSDQGTRWTLRYRKQCQCLGPIDSSQPGG